VVSQDDDSWWSQVQHRAFFNPNLDPKTHKFFCSFWVLLLLAPNWQALRFPLFYGSNLLLLAWLVLNSNSGIHLPHFEILER
jgi:hypothetical protein